MSLIFKTGVKYTGVVKAKTLLELLDSNESKLNYINGLLSSINYTSSYPTLSNITTIIDSLKSHINRVQAAGGNVLSMPYTLKAIIFVLQNNLSDSNYMAIAPDFGVAIDKNNHVTRVFNLSASTGDIGIENSGVAARVSKNSHYLDISIAGNGIILWNPYVFKMTNGSITGMSSVYTELNLDSFKSSHATNTATLSETHFGNILEARRNASGGEYVVFRTLPTGPSSTTVAGYSRGELNKKGIVGVYNNNSTDNKLYVNGELKADKTTNVAGDYSGGIRYRNYISPNYSQGLLEHWLINSNSAQVAKNLSVYLTRG